MDACLPAELWHTVYLVLWQHRTVGVCQSVRQSVELSLPPEEPNGTSPFLSHKRATWKRHNSYIANRTNNVWIRDSRCETICLDWGILKTTDFVTVDYYSLSKHVPVAFRNMCHYVTGKTRYSSKDHCGPEIVPVLCTQWGKWVAWATFIKNHKSFRK